MKQRLPMDLNNTVISQIPSRQKFPAETMGRTFFHNTPLLEEFQRNNGRKDPCECSNIPRDTLLNSYQYNGAHV